MYWYFQNGLIPPWPKSHVARLVSAFHFDAQGAHGMLAVPAAKTCYCYGCLIVGGIGLFLFVFLIAFDVPEC